MKTIEQKFEAIKEWVAAQESFPDRDPHTGEIMAKKRSGCLDVWIGSRPADRIVLNIETPLERHNHAEVLAIHAILGFDARDAVEAERARLTQVPTQTYDEFKANLAKAVKDDDFPMADMYVQCLQVQLLSAYTNLESRAAALVEALDEINHHHGYFYANGNGEYQGMGGEKILTPVGKRILAALEAYKKGAPEA